MKGKQKCGPYAGGKAGQEIIYVNKDTCGFDWVEGLRGREVKVIGHRPYLCILYGFSKI